MDEEKGAVFSATGDGHVIARTLGSGRQLWATRVGRSRPEGENLVTRAGVVVAPVLFHTVGLDALTGVELWRYRAPPDTIDGGALAPGSLGGVHVDADNFSVYIPAWGGSISAIDLRTGGVRWVWQPEPGIPHRFGAQGVRVSGGTVYATVWHFLNATGTVCEGWVLALDAVTGRQIWRTTLPRRSSHLCLPGAPAVTPGRVIVSMITGEVFGLDAQTGAVAWSVPRQMPDATGVFNAVISGPVAFGREVYVDGGTETLRALSADDGRVLWRTRYSGQLKHDLLATDRWLYGADGWNLHVFDRRTGRLHVTLRDPGSRHDGLFAATPAAAGGRIFAPVSAGLWAFPSH
ncbi:MAG: PQQ-binding-like beta-propeller repeat protein [Gemmatimonadetes bacterium]|nr:PQQ-binding-like beta-propeller repeat protein [Gemmatimonadota bacterium]